MADDYVYDVFFSYKRNDMTLGWTRRVSKLVEHWLSEELGRKANIFIDERSIEAGDKWPEAIRHGLKGSRCMVSVWSPSYFQSPWCVSEWKTLLKREEILNLAPHGLIAPLKFCDGEHFPQEAKDAQWIDVSPYSSTLDAFWNSSRALDLEDALKNFVRPVARMVRTAPAYDSDWPIVESEGFPSPTIEMAKL